MARVASGFRSIETKTDLKTLSTDLADFIEQLGPQPTNVENRSTRVASQPSAHPQRSLSLCDDVPLSSLSVLGIELNADAENAEKTQRVDL